MLAFDMGLGLEKGWRAELKLGFEVQGDKTVLAFRKSHGPLVVQRPFYPERSICHVYVLHPPGGVVGGDRLKILVETAKESRALITTPAAGKFYRSGGTIAQQNIHLSVGQGASLEWLPQENIFFDGARVKMATTVTLSKDARFIGWESSCLGRPAAQETFTQGRLSQGWHIWVENAPLLIEHIHLDNEVAKAVWGLRGNPFYATFYAYPFPSDTIDRVRMICNDQIVLGTTVIDGMLVCRGITHQMERLKQAFLDLWQVVRPIVIGRNICEPRIWAT
ncbi:MAG TPA: urease accessory protein UreD [Methylothermaceae bacterium]|nr:urease accessory protein UreD [Methylothermaceae bacterium]